jgi:hypothetical protein
MLFAEISHPIFKLKKRLMQLSEIRMNGLAWQFIMLLALPNSLAIALSRSTALKYGRSVLTVFLTPQVILTSVFVASLTSSRLVESEDAFLF